MNIEHGPQVTIDGNEAAAHVAYRLSDVCAIYPITPSSPMAELADEWSAAGVPNLWGDVPEVVEMQSEGGAAGAVHGAVQTGALTTTFTASQGLMLMLPNLYKMAGELSCAVLHVAARSLAAQGLSIFGDHSDVMAARTTGFAQLASASVQEAHDLALVAHAATLASRVPFLHFFDGFRTSHEVNKIQQLSDAQIRAMIDDEQVIAHRRRGLNPDHPVIRGTAQNPDVYFQARETVNPFYQATPGHVLQAMERFEAITGRRYRPFDYHGAPDAERVLVLMGSGAETAVETARYLAERGDPVGVVQVRLFRPFSVELLIEALPETVQRIAVLDRTKEPGAAGEPLYQDVVTALAEARAEGRLDREIRVVGGRYGLSSKEFTPAMVRGVYQALGDDRPPNHFTVGIDDDVSGTSIAYDPGFLLPADGLTQATFYGLGADGTVGANKNSIKIIGGETDLGAQGYFVYDSKKSGARTVSHLRFGPGPVRRPWLIEQADFVACHQFGFVDGVDMLSGLREGGTFLLNCAEPPERVFDALPRPVQETLIDRRIRLYAIDANRVAREAGMGNRINTVMQTCFFALAEVVPRDRAIELIKVAIEKSYARKGRAVVEANHRVVDAALDHLHAIELPSRPTSDRPLPPVVPAEAPDFVQRVTATMMAGQGDRLPVSVLPADGSWPSGTTRWEKRNIALMVPEWDAERCIQCGNCAFVCPHSVIRARFFHADNLADAPDGFASAPLSSRGFPDTRYTLQLYAEDCTGCGLCVAACPVHDPDSGRRAINLADNTRDRIERARSHMGFFETLPRNDRTRVDFSRVQGAQFLEPLFEFSGACAGCGETPYVKLLSQLFGERLVVANATGCSSIYGGNLPTTPWTTNAEGRGPAWSNSLFEDNAEFGLGMRVSLDRAAAQARRLLEGMTDRLGSDRVRAVLDAHPVRESEIAAQRLRLADLIADLEGRDDADARNLLAVIEHLVDRSVWLVGGDGWAYDIGSAGLDHVLASGRNVNVLVLDTEVYSNTGGQMSKATPTAATAKFAAAGKRVGKKDLALQAISYGNVYVAQVAMGANPQQTLLAFREAQAYPGPSLILAYSHCIAHGIAMSDGLGQQKRAVASGYWPLIRYNPALRQAERNPFVLDSPEPSIGFRDYAERELRYRMLRHSNPGEAEQLMTLAEEIVQLRWKHYRQMATWEASEFQPYTGQTAENTP